MNDADAIVDLVDEAQKGVAMQHANFFAMIQKDGGVYRFVIRDRARVRPSIHGFGRSMDEARAKIDEIISALDAREQQAA